MYISMFCLCLCLRIHLDLDIYSTIGVSSRSRSSGAAALAVGCRRGFFSLRSVSSLGATGPQRGDTR